MEDSICKEAALLIQQVMEAYCSGEPEKLAGMLHYFSDDCLIIGTGKHEFYFDFAAFLRGLEKDQEEAKDIDFIIKRQWYDARLSGRNSCVVFGEFEACEPNVEGKQVVINMDTRITASVHREPDGELMIDSVHQSVPYLYQQEGEYYPKTFANQAEEALKRSAILEKRIQLDSLTGLFNRQYTEKHINRMLTEDKSGGLMLMIDMDEFKCVNDEFGHLAGDELLKKVAQVLAREVNGAEIAGRIGGDEFMVFLPGKKSKEDGECFAEKLIKEISKVLAQSGMNQSCSIGIAMDNGENCNFEELYLKADKALYQAKVMGKRTYCWYQE